MLPAEDLPCPCCGFLGIEGEYGSYTICGVCGWEDDGVQLANPTSGGGANSESLAEVQAKAIARFPLEVQVAKGRRRGRRWRPLSAIEIQQADRLREAKHWHSTAVVTESEAYWSGGSTRKNEERI